MAGNVNPEEAQPSQVAPTAEPANPVIIAIPADQPALESVPEQLSPEKPHSVFTVANLLSTLGSGKEEAAKQFKGKILTVRDKVEKIGKHDLSLKNTSDADSVKCTLPSGVMVTGVRVGAITTVRGVFRARRFTGTILLADCELIAPNASAP